MSSTTGFTAEKERLLSLALKKRGIERGGRAKIGRRKGFGPAELSFAQQRLWFLEQLEPNTGTYNIPSAVRLEGELDLEALEGSFNAIIVRHEVLRTRFEEQDGNPVQVVMPELKIGARIVDLSGAGGEEQEQAVRREVREEAQGGFDLARGPLVRIKVLKLGEREHVLLCTAHHIVADAWSIGVLVNELAALYPALQQGRRSPLPELPVQYGDFAQWQREWLSGERLQQQMEYWKQQVEGAPEALQMPTDRPRSASHSGRGANVMFHMEKKLAEGLKELGSREGATLFMVLLAGFKVLLGKYTGQEDVVVGSPIANRHYEEVEPLIGFFVNTLVLRTDLNGDPGFLEFLGRVRETALGAYAHQDLPFERLVEQLGPERRTGRAPLFQVMFALQNAPINELQLPGLKLSFLPNEGGNTKFDFRLVLSEDGAGISGTLEYSTDLFEESTMRRMLKHYEHLLGSIVKDPGRRVSQLEMLGEAERKQLLEEFGRGEAMVSGGLLHRRFEAQVLRTPEAVAVERRGEKWSYSELNRRANQLGHYLRGQGVGPEVRVGICMERSVEMIVGLLGILKAGGAYVPLDASYPAERLRFMAEDGELGVVVSEKEMSRRAGLSGSWKLVCVDEEPEQGEIARESEENPGVAVDEENLAYVIYTSGSTGRPKGVGIRHGSAGLLVEWAQKTYSEAETESVLASTSISFDLSVYEIFVPLSRGGRVVMVKNALELAGLGEEGGVSLVNTVPSALAELLRMKGVPAGVRVVNLAGEALGASLVKQVYEQAGIERVFNLYGPSEDTTYSTWEWLKREEAGRGEVTIGRGVANTEAYVLDKWGELVPAGVAGELYLGGEKLARGYVGRADLTAERFVPNPYGGKAGARMYRTGDLVRWNGERKLEFLGRVDHQVKVRGYRIELGEIEAVLEGHGRVERAVVLAREGAGGDKRLVGYVVRGAGVESLEIGELRQHLRSRLPEYMVPAVLLELEKLPLSANGKIDRKALPEPNGEAGRSSREFVAPRTPMEEALARIWADVLHHQKVSVDQNFFEMGGHSLLVMQVVARVRKTLGLELPVASLFEEPTIAGLAHSIDVQRWKEKGIVPPPLTPLDRRPGERQVFPQSFSQQRLWFYDQLEPNAPTYNIPAALRMRGGLDVAALEESLNLLIQRHESLRTTFGMEKGQLVQIIAPELRMNVAVSNLESLPEKEREVHARQFLDEAARRTFDLAQGPLLHVALLTLSGQEHILLFNIHHIISDAWSMGVLVREWAALYSACSDKQEHPLPPLPIQYADFSQWQVEWLQFGVMEELLFYWQERLKGAPAMLEIQTDRPRNATQSSRGATVSFELDREMTSRLTQLAHSRGATLFMILLAGFKALLSRYTGQTDVIVGTPVANRQYEELEALIGFFVNTLVLRTDVAGDPTFNELISRVRETALGAYAHQDLPLERLVEQLAPERRWGRAPLFQVMFVLQNAPIPALELAGLSIAHLPLQSNSAKFDLSLHLHDSADGLQGALEYSTDLFDASTIHRMIGHYQLLLKGGLDCPDARLSELPIIAAVEHRHMIGTWGQGERVDSGERSIHGWFEKQAEKTPESVAVKYEDQELTYRELNQRANQVANYLISANVKPDQIVGLCMERGLEMVIGIFGILKAGGAYLPIDPAYPHERIRYMVQSTGIQTMVSQQKFAGSLQPLAGTRIVAIDKEWPQIAGCDSANPRVSVLPDHLCYAIFTSGSSGAPKAVAISHAALCNHMFWMSQSFRLTQADRVLQKTPFTFDASVWEFYAPLLHGGMLVMVKPGGHMEMDYLVEMLQKEGITILQVIPSILELLTREPGFAQCRKIRVLFSGGEALSHKLAAEVTGKLAFNLVNLYGPTETTIDATFWKVEAAAASGRVAIGRPIANSKVFVLDETFNPVPVGVGGELYIGGDNLARGYLGRPELTAERFIPNPFSAAGERMYRTGDRVKWYADGNLGFVGRVDNQVKLRGFRIEPGEIESALREYPAVRHAVVVAREDSAGDKRLVAYVEPQADASTSTEELKEVLRKRLPEFMVPGVFVILDTLPQTPHGKMDRRALPAPEKMRSESPNSPVAPRDSVETEMVKIWQELFSYSPIGVRDNFFEIGGHSLLALRLQADMRSRLGVQFPLAAIFEYPTIEDLAEVVRTQGGERTAGSDPRQANQIRNGDRNSDGPSSKGLMGQLRSVFKRNSEDNAGARKARAVNEDANILVPIQLEGSRAPFFCVHPVGGNVLCYAELARQLGQEQPFYGLQASSQLNEQDTIEEMASRYIRSIKTCQPEGPYNLGGWSMGGMVAFEMATQLRRQGDEVALLALLDSFPLEQDGQLSEKELLAGFIDDLTSSLGREISYDDSVFSKKQLEPIVHRLKQDNVLSADTDLAQLTSVWQHYKINHQALVNYRPGKYPGKITLIMAVASHDDQRRTPIKSWAPRAGGGLNVDVVPGNHYSFLRHPEVRITADKLRAFLEATSTQAMAVPVGK